MPNTPSQRSTRSGSNASQVSLNDIKILIETSKTEVVNLVKKENAKLENLIITLSKRLDDLETKNSFLESRCKILEEKCDSFPIDGPHMEEMFEEVVTEAMERQRRRKCLIVSGLPEHTQGSAVERRAHDIESLKSLAAEAGVDNLEPEEVVRIGRITSSRPRLLRFKCKTVNEKFTLLKKSMNLRHNSTFSRVFINPDMTRFQRETNKKLRKELRSRREAGEKVLIHRGRITREADVQVSASSQRQDF